MPAPPYPSRAPPYPFCSRYAVEAMRCRSTPPWAGLPPAIGQPLTVEMALHLICQDAADRLLSQPDDELIRASLVDHLEHKPKEDGPQKII